jgi:hypothetical protein
MDALEQLCSAIRNKLVVEFTYDRQSRVVQPHIVWRDKSGGTIVECWQTGGYTSRGAIPCWSRYSVERIAQVHVTGDRFSAPQPKFNADRPGDIICSL